MEDAYQSGLNISRKEREGVLFLFFSLLGSSRPFPEVTQTRPKLAGECGYNVCLRLVVGLGNYVP